MNVSSFNITNDLYTSGFVAVVKPFLFLSFAFIFVRVILCLKLNVAVVLVRGGRGRRSSAG